MVCCGCAVALATFGSTSVAAKSNKAVSALLTFCVIDGEALFDCSVDETSDVSADAARSPNGATASKLSSKKSS